ncbi:unnamed protein product [Anisakis simplex]|uniref:DNA repair and recombination protein RAD54-like n=1 Tax=Anisakis simplex TaxID=6269 RepID=A0A3P6Q011_ANISI|nr:unnamed protein product [Anisakis simplex]
MTPKEDSNGEQRGDADGVRVNEGVKRPRLSVNNTAVVRSFEEEPRYSNASIPEHCVVGRSDVGACLVEGDESCRRYSVVYGRVSTRVHKRWENDGMLICKQRFALLQDEDGKTVAHVSAFSKKQLESLKSGSRLVISGFELEIQEVFDDDSDKQSPTSSAKQTFQSHASQKTSSLTSSSQATVGNSSVLRNKFVQPLLNRLSEECNRTAEVFIVNKDAKCDVDDGEDIILDSHIARYLRPHQKDGITFLYKQLVKPNSGVILADEMGLGKSVQTIAIIWILLKQFKTRRNHKNKLLPAANNSQDNSSLKFLLITPTSLVDNWRFEFNKWLPHSASSLVSAVTKADDIRKFSIYSTHSPVLLLSYEMALRCREVLERCTFTLMICDEAHRLKNSLSNLRIFISSICAQRRLLLTGTPIQNDLNEFFSLVDLVKPGKFENFSEFKNLVDDENKEADLQTFLSDLMLRRTSDVISSYLPPKRNNQSNEYDLNERVLRMFPTHFEAQNCSIGDSGKLRVFIEIMVSLREKNEKVVIVSNFTKTLDMLEELCKGLFFSTIRLDGSVMANKRLNLVNDFNNSSDNSQVFLLSTKAGGVGLNLIGASRLILFDSDWNPAHDVQAMARIWRDGQKRPCFIYRLVTTGTIDEKILQRQVKKSGLSSVVELDSLSEPVTAFAEEDLRDIFSLDSECECATHELMACSCGGDGSLEVERNLTLNGDDDDFEKADGDGNSMRTDITDNDSSNDNSSKKDKENDKTTDEPSTHKHHGIESSSADVVESDVERNNAMVSSMDCDNIGDNTGDNLVNKCTLSPSSSSIFDDIEQSYTNEQHQKGQSIITSTTTTQPQQFDSIVNR